MTTTWDQTPLYNRLCPQYNGSCEKYAGQYTLTGCVATAMAQVMNYHQWPKDPTKEIPGYSYLVGNLDPQNELVENFDLPALPPITFDWANMSDYLFDLQGNVPESITLDNVMAVASLMLYCGQSVQMSYSPSISLANSYYVAQALRQFFDYDKGTRHVSRIGYSINDWENLIYQELANNRPVVYGGQSDDGGHAFVCDGYDGNGMFHINWGWSGMCDEYFSLSVLNPYAQNVSGLLLPHIGFCMNQEAVIGIQPPTEGTIDAGNLPELTNLSNYIVTDMGDYYRVDMLMQYTNIIYPQASFQLDLLYLAPDGQLYPINAGFPELDFSTGYSFNLYFSIPKYGVGLPDGNYRLYPYYVCTTVPDCSWQLLGSEKIYVDWTIQGGVSTLTSIPSASKLRISKCEITSGTGEPGTPNDLTLTIRNSGSEYQGKLSLTPIFIGNDDPKEAWKTVNSSNPWPEEYVRMDALVSAAYFKGGASVANHITFSFTPQHLGTYLLCLSEYPIDSEYAPAPFAYTSIEISDPTSLNEELRVKSEESTTAVYDLSGRRVQGARSKGFYIVNGKKVAF
jgi:hypothetical protein